jgi:hypothetical protein
MCRRLIFLICVVLVLGLAPSALAALPAGWSSQDIGAVGLAGSANESAGVWTLTASGADIWGTADQFHYAFTTLRGDGSISVRVATVTGGTNNWRKIGVMIRESLAANSKFAYMVMRETTYGGSFGWRPNTGGVCSSYNFGDPDIPRYVRLLRQANSITAWYSADGSAWTQYGGAVYIDMAAEVYVGLCLTSHNNAEVTTATFDSLGVVLHDPSAAYNPSPADWAVKVDVDADLTWTAGDGATSHDVWFGTNPAALSKVATKPSGSESYDPGTLAYNTDYYWQIVEDGFTVGPLWTFATKPDPAVTSDPDLVGYYKLNGDTDDSSGYGNHGTVLGDPTWVDGLAGNGQALALDGNGDCVNIGRGARDSYNFTGSFSISAWVNISELDWWGDWLHQIIGKRGEDNRSWVIRRHNTVKKLCFTTRGVGNDDMASIADPPLGEWCHITAVYDIAQNKKTIYFNGTQDRQIDSTVNLGGSVLGSDHDVYIGARANSGNTAPERNFTGMIDEVRLYSRALAAGEVATLAMHSEASGPNPADGSKVDADSVLLEWDPGKSAALHDVYFSDSFDDVDTATTSSGDVYKGRQTELKYPVPDPNDPFATLPVTRGETYYWRIDEVNGVDTWRGEIWSFAVVTNLNCSPSPEDEAKFVPVTADLSWTKGALALVGHLVYLSTDFSTVDSIAVGTMIGPEYLGYTSPATATSMVISGDLLSGTTYYWRADPIESSSPLTVHKGEVWSFTTLPKYTGSILREWWLGVNGGGIANLLNSPRYPSQPDGAALLSLFEGPTTWADNYGSRYRGWLLVQLTGYYKFWSVSDDNSQLFLSTDEDPANAVMISQTTASAGSRAWTDTDVTPSVPILLEAGRAYYIYALHKEGTGGDSMAVGWMGPGITSITVIPGSNLVPYMPAAINPSPANGAKDLPLAGTMLSWTAGFDAATFGDYASQRVYFGTDAAAVASAGVGSPEDKGAPTGTNSYGPVSLDYYKQYFWRIDGVTGGGQAVKGNVWSFTAIYDASQIVDPSLVGWWKLDGNADDSSGYANHGVENGNPLYVDAVDGLGIDFDGSNDYINCGNSPRLNMNTNITVACWVKGPLGPSWSPFVSKRGEDNLGWKLRRQGGNNEACFTLRGTSGADDQRGSININDNEWHHIAGTYDGAQRNLYVDGQLDTGGSLAETGAIPATPGDDVVIGAFSRAGQSPSIQTYSDATIDDARIYNRALTQVEIAAVMRINVAWAWNPDPKKGATGVSLDAVLTWNPGDYAPVANGHYVWLGADDPANMVRSGPQTPSSYTPSALDLDTTYYWAVDEVNGAGVDAGPIWSFTTINSLVVDDMETYTDWQIAGNNIVEAWNDGIGDCKGSGNDTGSTIYDYPTFSFAGVKSMKYDYDNDGNAYNPCDDKEGPRTYKYSKIVAQVADLPSGIGSDWTVGGARALSLRFYGDPNSVVIEPMWVELTDGDGAHAKVTYGDYIDEDPNDIAEAAWHEWLIDLDDFTSVNVSNVKSIAIGIGLEDDIGPYGSGRLYFDDIRLYAPRCVLARREADFAPFDYVGDCKVDYKELAQMTSQWLLEQETEVAWAPSSTWDHNDIGDTATAGDFIDNGDGSYSVTGSGADIWGNADAFHYVYKPLVGDGQMTVNVVGMSGTSTNVWQKAGVMIRETLDAGSRNVMMAMSKGPGGASTFEGGDAFQYRPDPNGASSSSHVVADNIEVLMPNCVRLVRNGDNFSGYVHVNGEWVQEGPTVTIAMPETVYIGLAVTSHDNAVGIYTTATFNSVCDSSLVGPDLVEDGLVNFVDYATLMDRFLDEDFFP